MYVTTKQFCGLVHIDPRGQPLQFPSFFCSKEQCLCWYNPISYFYSWSLLRWLIKPMSHNPIYQKVAWLCPSQTFFSINTFLIFAYEQAENFQYFPRSNSFLFNNYLSMNLFLLYTVRFKSCLQYFIQKFLQISNIFCSSIFDRKTRTAAGFFATL